MNLSDTIKFLSEFIDRCYGSDDISLYAINMLDTAKCYLQDYLEMIKSNGGCE